MNRILNRSPLRRTWPFIMIAMVSLSACAGNGEDTQPSSGDPQADERAEQRVGDDAGGNSANRPLYQRLGGTKGIAAIVNDMTDRVIADPRINFERHNVKEGMLRGNYEPWQPTDQNLAKFRKHMVEFISVASGGPAKYTGRDLSMVHEGMRITNNEFDAMIGDIKASMDSLGFDNREKRDLLAILETTRKQIVEEP